MVKFNPVEIIALAVTSLLYAATVFLNYWSSNDNGEDLGFEFPLGNVSDRYSLDVSPNGWTFAIWVVIYVWQALWLIYGWRFALRPSSAKIIPLLTYVLFSLSCGINVGWLYAFTNKEVAVAFVLLLLLSITLYATIGVSLVVFYYRVQHLKRKGQKIDLVLTAILLHNGLAMYATWTSVATLLNMGIIMQYTGDYRQDGKTVGLVVLGFLILEEIVWFLLENSVLDRYVRYIFTIYPVVIWALAGVLTKHISDGDMDEINSTTVGALVLSGLLFLFRLMFIAINHVCRKLEYPDIEYQTL